MTPAQRARHKRNAKWRRTCRRLFQLYATATCHVCGLPIKWDDFTADHIKRRRDGGGDEIENLKPAHQKCNEDRD